MCYNVFTIKINLFENKRFKDGRCITKITGSSHRKAQKRKLTPYLKKLCHEFIQNFHQIEWTKKIAARKLREGNKLKKIATDYNLVFKNLLA